MVEGQSWDTCCTSTADQGWAWICVQGYLKAGPNWPSLLRSPIIGRLKSLGLIANSTLITSWKWWKWSSQQQQRVSVCHEPHFWGIWPTIILLLNWFLNGLLIYQYQDQDLTMLLSSSLACFMIPPSWRNHQPTDQVSQTDIARVCVRQYGTKWHKQANLSS